MVVDDAAFMRLRACKVLQDNGHEVVQAENGLDAVRQYEEHRPDAVLMDITMPEMEGIEAAELIVRQHAEARVIMVSSVGYQENIVAALQRGARHFVQKPVKAEVLYEVIKYVMGEECVVAKSATQGS